MSDQEYDAGGKYSKFEKLEDATSKKKFDPKFTEYTQLNTPRSQILLEIEKIKRFDGGSHLYCGFYKHNGHVIDDCRQLKVEIEFLILRGKLGKYVKEGGQNQGSNNNKDKPKK